MEKFGNLIEGDELVNLSYASLGVENEYYLGFRATPEYNGIAQSITARLRRSSYDAHATCALYDDSKNLIAVTEEILITDTSEPPIYHTFDFPNPKPNVVAGEYYYGMVYGEADVLVDPNKTFLQAYRKAGEGLSYYRLDNNYPNFPDPLVVSAIGESIEIYCNYERELSQDMVLTGFSTF